MTSILVAFVCLWSLVGGQLILGNDRQNQRISLLPGQSSAAWTLGLPNNLANWQSDTSRAYLDSGLQNINIIRGGGSGVSSYALGGIPAYNKGSPIIALTGSVPNYGNLVGNRDIGLSNEIGQAVKVIQRPILLDTRRLNDQVLLSTPAVSAVKSHHIHSGSSELRPVNAAVNSLRRTVDYVPVGYNGEVPSTQVVNVPPNEQGLHINFFSKSSPLTVSQQHIPSEPGQVQVTESTEEPHRLIHNVKKEVVQEINEVVQPYRILKQEVKPVIEQSHLQVAQGENIPLSGKQSGIIAADNAIVGPVAVVPNVATRPYVVPQPSNIATRPFVVPQPANIAIAKPETLSPVSLTEPALTGVVIAEPIPTALAQPVLTQSSLALSRPYVSDSVTGIRIANENLTGLGLGNVRVFQPDTLELARPSFGNQLQKNQLIFSQPSVVPSSFRTSRFSRQSQLSTKAKKVR